ncbi:hypothetical protein D7252_07015 [Microbacterium sp. CGR2]|nr:hypothetical protein D7252_07015 [Microbacterium sp. CGR2]
MAKVHSSLTFGERRHRTCGSADAELLGDDQRGTAEQHDVVSAHRDADLEVIGDDRQRVVLDGVLRRLQEHTPDDVERPRQDHVLEPQCRDDRREDAAEGSPCRGQDGVWRCAGLGQTSPDVRNGGDNLEAPAPAAPADLAVVVDEDVPDLTRRESAARDERAADDDTASDALPDPDEGKIVDARLAVRAGSKSRGVGVVGDVHRHRDRCGDRRGDIEVVPVESDRLAHHARRVHDTG